MRSRELLPFDPADHQGLPTIVSKNDTIPTHEEEKSIETGRKGIIARRETDARQLTVLREQLGLSSETPRANPSPEVTNFDTLEAGTMLEEEGSLTPEIAMRKLFSVIDELESKGALEHDKNTFLQIVTDLLRIISKTSDPNASKLFKQDSHFQKLRIGSKFLIQNSPDRDLHKKVFTYLDNIGIQVTEEEQQEVKKSFEISDAKKRKETLQSYAQHGLLTLKSALEKGVLKETSSTPGDLSSLEDLDDLTDAEFGNIRGYELTTGNVSDTLFYGRNGFFGVVLERGGESIDRASQLPKIEVENRLRNSMIFVVKANKVEILGRLENTHKEDIVSRDIKPEEIDYIIVDKSNLALAQETCGHLPIKIVGAESVTANIEGLFDGPYTLPDYKNTIDQVTKKEGAIWCHVARLPVETYPKESPSQEKS